MSTVFNDEGTEHFGVLGVTSKQPNFSDPNSLDTSFGVMGVAVTSIADLTHMKMQLVMNNDILQPIWTENSERGGYHGTTVPPCGVFGVSTLGADTAGVVGENDEPGGVGVIGASLLGTGVSGRSGSGRGVWGFSESFIATVGDSTSGTGVWGHSLTGTGVYGEGSPAARFKGDVNVVGHLHVALGDGNTGGKIYAVDVMVSGGDCAEEFDISADRESEPGTVMILDRDGSLQPSYQAYDRRVAGVISGAGDLKPGIILDTQPPATKTRMPIGLAGKVYCKVDAQYASVEVGDLLTTSPTLGHAMKADDVLKAFGAVIGKALRPVLEGQAVIPILIALG